MNVLLYQTWSANNRALFMTTLMNHSVYASRHGYTLVTDCCDYSAYLNVPKIRALLEFADLVVTIGSDCIFTDMTRRLEEFLDADHGMALCEEGRGFSYLNGEVLFFRNTRVGRAFLGIAEKLQQERPGMRWGFQAVMNAMMQEKLPGHEYVQIIPAGTLQTYLERADRFQKLRWKAGDFMAHAIGGSREAGGAELKLKRVRDLLEEMRQERRSIPPVPQKPVDVLIPLGNGSCSDNDELRIALRSIERHVRNLGKVRIATAYAPVWLQNVEIVPVMDNGRIPKDANIFNKMAAMLAAPDCSERFIYMTDDKAFLADYDAYSAQTVYNSRGPSQFAADGKQKWNQRMHATFEFLKGRGIELKVNFDAHVPQTYTREEFLRAIDGIDYTARPGYCINTLVCGILGRKPEVDQMSVKAHGEGKATELDGKLFAGYDDDGFKAGMREKLFARFHNKSRYEK